MSPSSSYYKIGAVPELSQFCIKLVYLYTVFMQTLQINSESNCNAHACLRVFSPYFTGTKRLISLKVNPTNSLNALLLQKKLELLYLRSHYIKSSIENYMILTISLILHLRLLLRSPLWSKVSLELMKFLEIKTERTKYILAKKSKGLK